MAKQVRVRRRARILQPIASRPYLLAAVLFGAFLFFLTEIWDMGVITRTLIGWDGGILLFLALAIQFMRGADRDSIRRRAIEHDEGRHLMPLLAALAAVASVGALAAELSAKSGGNLRIVLAATTVILSWLFVQIVFAMHYAHVYYLAEESGTHQGGLEFGDYEELDYWDFVHFAVVLGATAQTADTVFRSKQMRRVGTLHTLVAFGFNTAILATMIEVAASLF